MEQKRKPADYWTVSMRLRCTIVDVTSDGPSKEGTYLGLTPDDHGELDAVVHVDGELLLQRVHRSRITILDDKDEDD